MRTINLIPTDNRKSFYGKAKVTTNEDGTRTLYSYGTKILTKHADGNYTKHWHSWTATTGRHIAAFCGMNKKEYANLNKAA